MTKTYFEVCRLCQEFGLHEEELPQQLFKFIKFKSYPPSKTIQVSELTGEKRAFIASGLVYVYQPEETGQEPTRLVKVFGKNTTLCEMLPNLSEEAIFKVKKNARIFFMRGADHGLIKAIPGMGDLNDGINRNMVKFNDAWAGLIQRPSEKSLNTLFGMFPGHKFKKTDLANLYGISRTAFYKVTELYLKKLYEKHYPSKKKAA